MLVVEVERTVEGVGVRQERRQGENSGQFPRFRQLLSCHTLSRTPLREPENRIRIQLAGYLISYSPGADFTIDGPYWAHYILFVLLQLLSAVMRPSRHRLGEDILYIHFAYGQVGSRNPWALTVEGGIG